MLPATDWNYSTQAAEPRLLPPLSAGLLPAAKLRWPHCALSALQLETLQGRQEEYDAEQARIAERARLLARMKVELQALEVSCLHAGCASVLLLRARSCRSCTGSCLANQHGGPYVLSLL